MIAGDTGPRAGYEEWIVKFRSSGDYPDIGPLEAAYADMGRAAGLHISETRLISARRGPGYFATKRFDRGAGGAREHIASIAGLLDIDWSIPNLDYNDVLNLTRKMTRTEEDVRAIFRRMVFNVAAHNRDDHTKQHSFRMDRSEVWRLAPAYDLTFALGPGSEHYLTVKGRGSKITREHIEAIARAQSIPQAESRRIIDEVAAAVSLFPKIAKKYGLSKATTLEVSRRIRETCALATGSRTIA